MTARDHAAGQAHGIEACFNNGWDDAPAWKVVCECAWEAWDYPTEASVRCSHAFHVAKELADRQEVSEPSSDEQAGSQLVARTGEESPRTTPDGSLTSWQAHGQDGTGTRPSWECSCAPNRCNEIPGCPAFERISKIRSGRPQSGPSESSGTGSVRDGVERAFTVSDGDDQDKCPNCGILRINAGYWSATCGIDFRQVGCFVTGEVSERVEGTSAKGSATRSPTSTTGDVSSPPESESCARCVSLQEALQRAEARIRVLEAALLPFTFDPDAHISTYPTYKQIVAAREALAASENGIPGGDPRSPVAEVGD